MKCRSVITCLFFAAWLITGCEKLDLIVEKPKSDYLLAGVNQEVLEGLVVGVYEPMSRSRGRLWESYFSSFQELMAEYAWSSNSTFQPFSGYRFNILDQTYMREMWTTFYGAIGRANFLIQALEEGSNTLPATVLNQAKAEAQFVRAICYYNIVRTWGKVPMRLKPVANADQSAQPLSEITAIYAQIVADFKFAEQYLPNTVAASKAGRATKGAAITALADVYLTMKDYTNARAKAKEVLDNSKTYGYELEPSLSTIYSPSAPTNKEEVFAIKFAQIRAQGNFLTAYAHDDRALAADLAARGLGRFHTKKTVPLIRDWDTKDTRRSFNLYDTIVINGVKLRANLPANADYFFGKYKDPDAAEETAAGNDFYLYRYADVFLIFAESDNQLNGPTTEGYEAINKVRRRGYGVAISTPNAVADLPAGLSKTDLDDLIFRERGYEFFFECKRWYDLKRTGRWEKLVKESGIKTFPGLGDYWPIPDVELANNPALK